MATGFSLTATAEPEVANSLVKTLSGMFGLLLIVGLGVGLAGFFIGHEHIFNNTREVPWGLLISTYAFFCHHLYRTLSFSGNQPRLRR